ncbi:calponin homology domain-containing protein [Dichotomocladium elegans]|nr:calponin homology domain-containing protein [Dichotomocladium elegans]
MGESRTELLAWLNELLALHYTKVEQAGTGAAYAQVMDSIYGDVHMSKVKFDTKQEYEYINNYKILQHTFNKHKVDKIVPVDKLVKCKFQDNLEFLQWLKRFWEQNYPGGAYDPIARRKGGGGSTGAVGSRAGGAAGRTAAGSATTHKQSSSMIIELNKQISELKMTVDGLEKERDFYFGKLRDIEILVQEEMEAAEQQQIDLPEMPILKDIQTILYSTEVRAQRCK